MISSPTVKLARKSHDLETLKNCASDLPTVPPETGTQNFSGLANKLGWQNE